MYSFLTLEGLQPAEGSTSVAKSSRSSKVQEKIPELNTKDMGQKKDTNITG